MEGTRGKRKVLRESNPQSTNAITKEKISVFKRIPKSKVVLKSSKPAPNAELKSKVITRQLRKRTHSVENNNADKTESKISERLRAKKIKKPVNKSSTENAETENSRLRSGLREKMANNDSEEESIKDETKSTKRVLSTKKHKLLKQRRTHVENTEQETENVYEKDLSKDHILQCINAIFHLSQEKLESKEDVQNLFSGESQPIFMQVTCARIPKVPRRHMRMLLPHSIVTPDEDVALFVCDLQKGRRRDYEPTKDHYEELLKIKGFTRPITIIPLNQVKTEYDQFELKRKLAALYDHFFVDGRISGHITHLLGNEFYKRRKVPISVKMSSKDLKHEIEWAMKKTTMRLHSYGDTHLVQIGNTSMKKEHIFENILAACKSLAKDYPGGWANICSLRIKTPRSLAIPIFITLKNKNTVPVPVIRPKRPKAFYTVKDELSTIAGDVKVAVTPDGKVTLSGRDVRKNFKRKES